MSAAPCFSPNPGAPCEVCGAPVYGVLIDLKTSKTIGIFCPEHEPRRFAWGVPDWRAPLARSLRWVAGRLDAFASAIQ